MYKLTIDVKLLNCYSSLLGRALQNVVFFRIEEKIRFKTDAGRIFRRRILQHVLALQICVTRLHHTVQNSDRLKAVTL